MRMRWKKSNTGNGNEEPFTICISDLMAGLLGIFILTLIFYMITFSQATVKLTENSVNRSEILDSISRHMKSQGVRVTVDIDKGVMRLPEEVLFDIGEADVKERSRNAIRIL